MGRGPWWVCHGKARVKLCSLRRGVPKGEIISIMRLGEN